MMLLAVTSTWAQKAETKFDEKYDFSKCKTYAWLERKLLTQQGKENQDMIEQALVSAIDAQLKAKGLTEDQKAPDLLLSMYGGSRIADAKAGTAYTPMDLAGYGVTNMWTTNTVPGSSPNVWVSVQGLALFEMSDPNTKDVVWSNLLKKKIKNPGKMPKDLYKSATMIATKAFENFPPKAKGK